MISALKSLVRRIFYRSRLFQLIVGGASVVLRRSEMLGVSHLLSYQGRDAIGPLQRDEAIVMFGIVKTLRPKTVLEFGFFHGHSAFNFLRALDADAMLYSYDVSDESALRAKKEFSFEKRLTFIHKSQTEFEPGDIGHKPIDFVFFDAAHELALNIETFQRIFAYLTPEAIIAVHDTGLWERSCFAPIHDDFTRASSGRWVSEKLYAHQPEERGFVDWIVSNYQGFGTIHFHSTRTLRHGFSLLQRQSLLKNGPHEPLLANAVSDLSSR